MKQRQNRYYRDRFKLRPAADVTISRETLNGREHLVFPIIALKEGVLNCATCPNPEFVPASEIEKSLVAWSAKPLTFDHPSDGGEYVAVGATPSVYQSHAMGFTFNVSFADGSLKVDGWLDIEKAKEIGASDLVDAIEAAEMIEVSTGYFVDVDPRARGVFNGEKYQGRQFNIVPDHLALLPLGVIGACSNEDGCGAPRLNAACSCGCGKCGKQNKWKVKVGDKYIVGGEQ